MKKKLEIFEKCPNCAEELESGFVISRSPIYWSDKIPRLICTGRLPITGTRLLCAWSASQRCPKCKLVILKHL